MSKLDSLLEDANQRLRDVNTGISIYQRGKKLSLRGMLPNKNGSGKKQQIISLGIYFNAAGIKSAEKQAQKLSSQLALNEFSWENWATQNNNLGTMDYWVREFEKDYFNRKQRTGQSETTWKTDYQAIFKKFNPSDLLNEETLTNVILSTNPDTRTRKRAVVAVNALANIAGLDCDFTRYAGNYSHLKGERNLPTDVEIAKYYHSIQNPHWQRVYGLIACYGLSNHEIAYLDLDSLQKAPGHLISTYRKDHYGLRRIWCLYPEWFEEWKLYENIDLPKISGKTNGDIGHRVSTQFRRYKLCKPGDLRHCWAIRAMGFMPDAMAARMMAHTTAVHNETYKRWLNENQEDQFYKLLMQRDDRPKPPSI